MDTWDWRGIESEFIDHEEQDAAAFLLRSISTKVDPVLGHEVESLIEAYRLRKISLDDFRNQISHNPQLVFVLSKLREEYQNSKAR